ncbi:MAG: aryl-sulfate sulfotransferase [Planctomycetota bacterium]
MRTALALALVLPFAPSDLVAQDGAPPERPDARPPERERPQEEGQEEVRKGLIRRTDAALDGYTLLAPLQSTTTYLVDMEGRVVHRWESQYPPGQSAYLLDDGHLLRTAREGNDRMGGGGEGGRIQEFDWDGNVVWEHVISSNELYSHHDVEPMPNGNVLVVAWEYLDRDAAIALGRDPEHVGEDGFWPDVIMELRPTAPSGAEVVWKWRAADHLIQDFDSTKANYGDVPLHPERLDVNADHRDDRPVTAEERARLEAQRKQMEELGYIDASAPAQRGNGRNGPGEGGDWMHTNGIDYCAKYDLIVISSRHLSEVFVVDHSTTTEQAATSKGGRYGRGGDILYRWGNPVHYGAGNASSRTLFEQHDPEWVVGDDGLRLTVFNNGGGRPGGDRSTVDEILLPFDPEKGFLREGREPFGPEAPAWSYGTLESQRFHASFISGAQRLPNGSTIVCDGPAGRILEVDRAGEVVWEFVNPFGGDRGAGPGGRGGRGMRRGPRGQGGQGGLPRADRCRTDPAGRDPAGRSWSEGGPPRGEDGWPFPPGRGPGGAGGPGGPDGRRGGGPGGMSSGSLFRATRIPKDASALRGRTLAAARARAAPAASPRGRRRVSHPYW